MASHGATDNWHPKLTPDRLLIITTAAGFGVLKAILNYTGNTAGSVTIGWVSGVHIFAFVCILGIFEEYDFETLQWLFHTDLAECLWKAVAFWSLPTPSYKTEERPTRIDWKDKHPKLTLSNSRLLGHDLLWAHQSCAFLFGLLDGAYDN